MDNKKLDSYLKTVKGVTRHGNSLRLDFSVQGKRYRKSINIKSTKSNVDFVKRKLESIKYDIATNTFDMEKYFPSKKNITDTKTFLGVIDEWLEFRGKELDPNTLRGYEKNRKLISKTVGDIPIEQINEGWLLKWRKAKLSVYSNKYINNIFSLVRGTFKFALMEGYIDSNPLVNISNLPISKKQPKPFTREDIETLENHVTDKESEQNYVLFSCWTGMRGGEALALSWSDIDFDKEIVYVNRSVVNGLYKRPKNGKSRTVVLLKPALEALKRQWSITSKNQPKDISVLERDNKTFTAEKVNIIFTNSNSGLPFRDIKTFGKVFWDNFLEECGVEHRGPNQCRHTYASQLITTGEIHLERIAQQMGTSVNMLNKHYGKIIDEDAKTKSIKDSMNRVLFESNKEK